MIRLVDPGKYRIPMKGGHFHHNIAWYATEDDKVLGVLIRDKIDNDYSWVVLTQNDQGPGYTAVDLDHSKHTVDIAREELHAAMEKEAANDHRGVHGARGL